MYVILPAVITGVVLSPPENFDHVTKFVSPL